MKIASSIKPKILDVVDADLCISCGACVQACPYHVATPSYSKKRGAHEIKVTKKEHCLNCDAPCERACPSITVDYAELQKFIRKNSLNFDRQGYVRSVLIGYSPKFKDNGVLSSGGVIRSIIANALENMVSVICLASLIAASMGIFASPLTRKMR